MRARLLPPPWSLGAGSYNLKVNILYTRYIVHLAQYTYIFCNLEFHHNYTQTHLQYQEKNEFNIGTLTNVTRVLVTLRQSVATKIAFKTFLMVK